MSGAKGSATLAQVSAGDATTYNLQRYIVQPTLPYG